MERNFEREDKTDWTLNLQRLCGFIYQKRHFGIDVFFYPALIVAYGMLLTEVICSFVGGNPQPWC